MTNEKTKIMYWICDDQTDAMWNSDTDSSTYDESCAQTYTKIEAEEMRECWENWGNLREVVE